MLSQEVMKLTGGVGIGRICECAGAVGAMSTCFTYLRNGGRVVIIGAPKEHLDFEHPFTDLCMHFIQWFSRENYNFVYII